MSKHTRGPWVSGVVRHRPAIQAGKHRELFVAEILSPMPTAFWDAQLIAAAPDLLAALEKIIQMCRLQATHEYGDAEKAESWGCVTTARAAIAKALGGEPQ